MQQSFRKIYPGRFASAQNELGDRLFDGTLRFQRQWGAIWNSCVHFGLEVVVLLQSPEGGKRKEEGDAGPLIDYLAPRGGFPGNAWLIDYFGGRTIRLKKGKLVW